MEEAYHSWVSDPFVDVRAVYSGHWHYMVDFNQMQQTNIDHSAHTVRSIRRVRTADGTEAMEEQRKIRRQVVAKGYVLGGNAHAHVMRRYGHARAHSRLVAYL